MAVAALDVLFPTEKAPVVTEADVGGWATIGALKLVGGAGVLLLFVAVEAAGTDPVEAVTGWFRDGNPLDGAAFIGAGGGPLVFPPKLKPVISADQ